MKYSSHNYGIDILRIISIVGVIVLHVLGHGGILASVESPTSFSMAMAFETLAFPAVNCFVLISGYVGYRDDKLYPKLKNIINLFFVVVFYSVLITLLFITTFSSKRDLLASFSLLAVINIGFSPHILGCFYFLRS